MTPEEALARGKAYLDEATENLTFEEFDWAFEEVWHGVAWVLNALLKEPLKDVETGLKGEFPRPGSLRAVRSQVESLPRQASVVGRLEGMIHAVELVGKVPPEEVADLVFDAWKLHDVCGQRLGLVDERLTEGRLVLTEASPGRLNSPVMERRTVLKLLAASSLFPAVACRKVESDNRGGRVEAAPSQSSLTSHETDHGEPENSFATVASVAPIRSMQWETSDPFLFCAHHRDDYPEGNQELGPAASLAGRHLGRDFDIEKPWRMYHGRSVPGFPRHPHRGFETVTIVRTGYLDHADSMGATARYGGGDVQWLTAGQGIQHAEMFPLLRQDEPNPLELFQVWLNLPRADKMVDPYFTMLWREKIPQVVARDDDGREVKITIAAGSFDGEEPPAPPPNSWASRAESDLAIWSLQLSPGAEFLMPAVAEGTMRSLYVHTGEGVEIAGQEVGNYHRVVVEEPGPLKLKGGGAPAEVLLLQGRPINEPVAKRGPFVMNTQEEIQQAYRDYQQTAFGGWPWAGDGPVNDRRKGRFARHIDGSFEEPV